MRDDAAGRLFAAICAAPALALQGYGVLKQRRMTCYPAFSERLSGCTFVDQPVVVDGRVTGVEGLQGQVTIGRAALEVVLRLLHAQGLAQRLGDRAELGVEQPGPEHASGLSGRLAAKARATVASGTP